MEDRTGVLFFTIVFYSFHPMFTALTACELVERSSGCSSLQMKHCSILPSLPAVPAERVVINKERASGSYHLSAYYLAKTLSELPLVLILPSIHVVIVYWAAGLNGWASFFGTWFFILLGGFLTQVSIITSCNVM